MRKASTVAVAVAVAAITLGGAGTAGADIVIPTLDVDTAKVAQSLHTALGGGATVGYGFAITENIKVVQLGAAGKARVDTGVAFTPFTRLEIASSTKNIVAAALLKLTEAAGITPEDKIWPYLPPDMREGADPSWQNVKIKHILGHQSGLGQLRKNSSEEERADMTGLYAGIKYMMAKQVTPNETAQGYFYENRNYDVARVVISRLWRLTDPGRGLPDWIGPTSPPLTLHYVNEKLLAPAGIQWVTCLAENPDTEGRAYNRLDTAQGGSLFEMSGPDFEACASHRGLRMSAVDLARWQVHLRYGTIVTPTVRQWMDTLGLGWRPYDYLPSGGYAHGGRLHDSAGRAVRTCHGKFAGNVEVTLVVNSWIGPNDTHPCAVVASAVKSGS